MLYNDVYKYDYDFASRLSRFIYNNYETNYTYDEDHNIIAKYEKLSNHNYSYNYSYNSETHTITFNNELYPDEHAIVWIMYNNSSEQAQIGRANLILKYWENTASFNANQIWDDVTVDLETDLWIWDIAHDSIITIKQWWIDDQSFTTNQADNDDIKLSWLIPMTQEEYNDEPDTKLTDNNWYFIVEEN